MEQAFYRSFALNRETLNKETHSIGLSFSSELPYHRWFGDEILLHGATNVDLGRLQGMGAALMNHNPDMILGRLENVRLSKKTGKADLIFDQDLEAQKIMGKVESGSLRGVSVGYIIHKFKKLDEKEEWNGFTGPAYIATKWEPFEISLTPIPADSSVGIGRDLSRSLEGIEIEGTNQIPKEDQAMTPEELRAIIEEERKKSLPQTVEAIVAALDERSKPKLRISPEEALNLLGRAGAISPEVKGKAAEMIFGGKTREEVTNFLLEEFTKKKTDARDGGGAGGDGTGLPKPEGKPPVVRALNDIPDEDFIAGLTNPHDMNQF